MLDYDPQSSGAQYLEDIATAYWHSETLFAAVELGLFDYLEPDGCSILDLSVSLRLHPASLDRYMRALEALGLVVIYDGVCCNSLIARQHLLKGSPEYQGNSILWRKQLGESWSELRGVLETGGRTAFCPDEDLRTRRERYIKAMDDVARVKATEIIKIFSLASPVGRVLDIGAGSGAMSSAFLDRFPDCRATLVDIPGVIEISEQHVNGRGKNLNTRSSFVPANILEPWPDTGGFDVIILSNIIHAFAETELEFILDQSVTRLNPDGVILIHDFFCDHTPQKAAVFDLNMMINTYNGKVFDSNAVRSLIASRNLACTELLPLSGDTALTFAARNAESFGRLDLRPVDRLMSELRGIGFRDISELAASEIITADWVSEKCEHGCSRHEFCEPRKNDRSVFGEYRFALLLESTPPTRDFQKKMLEAEKTAFLSGWHKALAYWAGPCSLCDTCAKANGDSCSQPGKARVSMEAAGIDVFETVRRAGVQLRTLNRNDYVKYFGLLLLE